MNLRALMLASVLVVAPLEAGQNDHADASGRELMDAVQARHYQYPYIYEEQSMLLTDRHGRRETRRMRSFMRIEDDGAVKFMLLFDSPTEVQGVAVMAFRAADGETRKYFYLPAFGEELLEATGGSSGEHFLGTDFAIQDLTGVALDDFEYLRLRDRRINGVDHFLVEARRRGEDMPAFRHYILSDNLFIVRTDHLDQFGRVSKRQTFHDLRPVGGGVWRASIVRMDDLRAHHQSLIRIEHRVFSRDYVPSGMFSVEWLVENQRPMIANTAEGEQ